MEPAMAAAGDGAVSRRSEPQSKLDECRRFAVRVRAIPVTPTGRRAADIAAAAVISVRTRSRCSTATATPTRYAPGAPPMHRVRRGARAAELIRATTPSG